MVKVQPLCWPARARLQRGGLYSQPQPAVYYEDNWHNMFPLESLPGDRVRWKEVWT